MFLLKYLAVFFGVIFVHGALNTTTDENQSLIRDDNATTKASMTSNHTKMKRRVLIVNGNGTEEHANLRNRPNKKKGSDGKGGKKKKETNTLLYQEWNNNNEKLNEFWMYKLDDVVEFFKIYLDTEICEGECVDED